MDRAEIIRVWGRADSFALEYRKDENDGKWKAEVPADLDDGQYAVEIYAMNEHMETAYWTGILYMLQGTVCLHIEQPKYLIWMLPQKIGMSLCDERITISVNRRCIHAGR